MVLSLLDAFLLPAVDMVVGVEEGDVSAWGGYRAVDLTRVVDHQEGFLKFFSAGQLTFSLLLLRQGGALLILRPGQEQLGYLPYKHIIH